MNKKSFIVASIASTMVFGLASCFGGKETEKEAEFDFSIALSSKKTTLEWGDKDQVVVSPVNVGKFTPEYTYSVSNDSILSINDSGYVVAQDKSGAVEITVSEKNSQIDKTLIVNVEEPSVLASGGFNYSSATGDEAIAQRTEILGKLEKYAVDKHLTGITLFENGGYVKYNTRITIPASEYITGYGFGILSEGTINADLPSETVEAHKRYYHSAQTNDPGTINAWDDTGSQVSDLSGYITSSYWSTKMNSKKTGYEWYPLLAADTVDGKANTRPVPVYDEENPLGLYNTWKIYVKTGDNANLRYRYSGSISPDSFENRKVDLEDYKFVYQLLLTGANGQTRGSEMAGDKTYGIKGAQAFYNRTKSDTMSQEQIDNIWRSMTKSDEHGYQDPSKFKEQQLGIMTGTDEFGSYIQLEILKEIDAFTAMYTLSSNLVSPIPREFIETIAGGADHHLKEGVELYGVNSSDLSKNIVDHTISLGAYKLDDWNSDYLAFGKNDSWFEKNRYFIKGVKIKNCPGDSSDDLYKKFNNGLLDSTGIPEKYLKDEIGQEGVKVTKGDSTFKLNINSCDKVRWNELFGPNGSVAKGSSWDVKPWMSNQNFLNGLYWAIDRETFARNRGYQPSINYFSNAYLSDPEGGIAYNDTDDHANAVKKWHTIDRNGNDDYGYNLDKAVSYFKSAVYELSQEGEITFGTKANPYKISIHIRWMYEDDINNYGNDIGEFITSAFNNDAVCGGRVKLEVVQEAVPVWSDVYEKYMMKGQFDLAFGAISGNTYSPLNFMEVLKSDNSSGFTLNFGPDTNKVDEINPIVYDGMKWSYDALWEVSDRGGIVEDGHSVKAVKNYYFDELATKISDGTAATDYSVGIKQDVNLEFVNVTGAEIKISRVELYVSGGDSYRIPFDAYNPKTDKKLHLTVDSTLGESIRNDIDSIVNKNKSPGDSGYVSPEKLFTRTNYGETKYWSYEVYFTLSINGGTPSEQYISLVVDRSEQI